MKRFLIMLLVLCNIFTCMTCFAQDDIKVVIYGEQIEFDVSPMLINDRTMVPMRKIFETLGANVKWFEESETIIATKGSKIITMEIGLSSISVTDVVLGKSDTVTIDVPPQIVNDRTLVPIRAVSETLGKLVTWDDNTQTVYIDDIK